ncbi:MAG: hypothetical protein WD872_04055 [Pirellulaceae bacterium]
MRTLLLILGMLIVLGGLSSVEVQAGKKHKDNPKFAVAGPPAKKHKLFKHKTPGKAREHKLLGKRH